jgi:hypothetical protein
MEAGPGVLVFSWIALHVLAFATACGTRLAVGSRVENAMQLFFFAALAAVGVGAWVCQHQQVGSWGLSAVTLVGMVITAVIDFRRFSEPSAAHAASRS